MMKQKWFTLSQAAEHMGVSVDVVEQSIIAGDLKAAILAKGWKAHWVPTGHGKVSCGPTEIADDGFDVYGCDTADGIKVQSKCFYASQPWYLHHSEAYELLTGIVEHLENVILLPAREMKMPWADQYPELRGHAWALSGGPKVSKDDLIILEKDINPGQSQETESPRKIDNLLRALVCMAVDVYGYQPDDARSTTPTDIVKAMEKNSVSVTDKTIRGWLKEGVQLLPKAGNDD
ncbi:MAG: hypothetical protein ACAH09_05650 [Methylophilaceae bacterium]|jgi:hypothetical protein|uniref:hypothetical protein n=1 Tax=Methylobacillus sp. MM3 TaxID=1848039 RepID=UPI0007DEF669|nr:hypothetical protein [Methylobacillus sp. MM3]OAJ71864.1 hypothetical protein A7976_10440 [Methylobacillus sp. MM3]